MMIVSVTRCNLRDEFAMADEAFALSPISARAAQPSEEDYDAISQAFMETSRGRWFLGEYARRNRNADTRMVLDAVARIEESLAAQKQPPPESGLTDALAAIRQAVDEAQSAATAALESLALEENLAPIRKGARIIKEISWRWREIGADTRICDLIDSQVGAIEDACGQIAPASPQAALIAVFDLIKARIAGEAVPPPSAAAPDEMPAAAVETAQAVSAADDTEAAIGIPAEAIVETAEIVEVTAEVADVTAEDADMVAEALDVTSEAADETSEAADAYDQALLDLVAREMDAPDSDDTDDASNDASAAGEIHAAASPPTEPVIVAEKPDPMDAPAEPTQHSLGSTLIANGIVRRPDAARSDPLAPIRRMSLAEKIAFFS
jgi:hypothetical protein